jgi:uncharacterized repeat protein (TIGR01451 family)
MKKLYFLLTSLCLFTSFNAQIITVQDSVLKNILVNTKCVDSDFNGIPDVDVDSNDDGEIDNTEASAIKNLYIIGNVSSLDGFDGYKFPYINFLSIKNTLLTSIRLKSFGYLNDLRINDNAELRGLYLSSLDALLSLDCSNNQLGTIQYDLINNVNKINCSNNKLKNLYLGTLNKLRYLDCSNNAISNLYINRSNSFDTLEFNNNTSLTSICVDYNDLSLVQSKLNAYGMSNVAVSINCDKKQPCIVDTICFDDEYLKFNILNAIDVDLNYDGEIQFDEALQLTSLRVHYNVRSLAAIGYFTNLTDLKIIGTQVMGTVDLRKLVNLKTLDVEGNVSLGSINLDGLNKLDTIQISNNRGLGSLYANGLTNLVNVICTNNNLFFIKTSGLQSLQNIDISRNKLGVLNLSDAVNLKTLKCTNNFLSDLNIGATSSLIDLDFSNNKIVSYNFLPFINLKSLNFENNLLSSFDLTGLNSLEVLSCASNNLKFLDLTYLPSLKSLSCNNSSLTGLFIKNNNVNPDLNRLDISGNPNLSHICADTVDYTVVQNSISKAGMSNSILDSNCDYSNPCGNNIVCINDVNFKKKLIALGVDTNNDKLIQVSEALTVTTLNVSTSATDTVNNIRNLNGIEKFTNLQTLNCDGNEIASLDLSGLANLKNLTCSENKMKSLNLNGLSNLEIVTCNKNLLSSLDLTGLSNLINLNCSFNVLQDLNCSNLMKLKTIDCSENNITQFNFTNCNSLETLNCSGNEMILLDVSNLITLKSIDFSNCSVIKSFVHTGLINLLGLTFGKVGTLDSASLDLTDLKKLKALNVTNKDASSGRYNLSALDVSGLRDLIWVSCEGTHIDNLDLSAAQGMQNLKLNYASINVLNIKNGTAFTFDSSASNFKTSYSHVDYICIDDFEKNYIEYCYDSSRSVLSYKPNINTYCTYEPGGDYNVVTGVLRYDDDNNGCDVNDVYLSDSRIKTTITSKVSSTYTDGKGSFTINTNQNNITVTPVFQNNYFTAIPSSRTFNFSLPNSKVVADFCIVPNGVHHDLEISLLAYNSLRPGFVNRLILVYKNNGNLPQSGNVSLSYNDSKLEFIKAEPSQLSVMPNVLTWSFLKLMPFETRTILVDFKVNAPTDFPAVNSGDEMRYTASISSNAVDENPIDNISNLKLTATNSFDPNDKNVTEGAQIEISKVGEYLHYMVRFQNTGTAEAVNVVIKDLITSNLDANTLEMITASHNCHVNLSSDNKLEFYFEDINLPAESINEQGSHGYVAFKIKPNRATVGVGSVMDNTAEIYFDYNFPIVTNTVTTTIAALSNQDFEFKNYFTLYPNPVHNSLNIETNNAIEVSSINIYNTLGQLVLIIPNAQNVKTVDVSSLTSGNYFIKINSDKGTSNTKFIKN